MKSLSIIAKASITLFVVTLLLPFSDLTKPQVIAQKHNRDIVVTRTETVTALPGQAKRWALVIGVDQYRDSQISSLKGAANDARTLADALVNFAGFPRDQVILLATDQPEERQPTRINILRRLSNLAAVVPKDGLLLVSFSGHGMERQGRAFLIPSDAQLSDDIDFVEETAISVIRMADRIKATKVQQIVLLLDACRNDPTGRADAPNPLTEAYVKGFDFDLRNREVTAFATIYATAVGDRAYESGEKRQGYFTMAVVEALSGMAANDKGEVTLAALLGYVQEQVPKRIGIDLGKGKRQRPFAVIDGYKANELVVAIVPSGGSKEALSKVDPPSMHTPTTPNKSSEATLSAKPPKEVEQVRTFNTRNVSAGYGKGKGFLYVSPGQIGFKSSDGSLSSILGRSGEKYDLSFPCKDIVSVKKKVFGNLGEQAVVIKLQNNQEHWFEFGFAEAIANTINREQAFQAIRTACGRK